ncbi:twin-arginine translocation signal domain-containing protein [Planosporangium thailandense]|uniref:Twin-arginine translocation signal domain-containing protein n=1 Tax=Planosporangium thailandense TaxID=765197 RepID=A0ABX0XZL1_9ACTN|nr:alkaline phosphatase D family protein [Planosporangium thailandense]NJC71488.1 twin-arginine translocation signal domain-containing protein [Planosporangium thailandense]
MVNTSLERRTLLKAAGTAAGAAAVLTPLGLASPAHAATTVFQHGVASGDPLPDGILLWTRVTPTDESRPGSGLGPVVAVEWHVATDPGFAAVVRSGTVSTGPDRDHTVKIDVTGLRPATTYYYRFRYGATTSPVGRTHTAPAYDTDLAHLRLGVVSCANWEAGYFSAYRHLAARGDLDAVVHLGDYIYEYKTGEFAAAGRVVRPHQPANEIITLRDYRIRHATYKTDPDLQALHALVPWIITWDDHEFANDAWSGGAQNHDPATEGSWADRVAAAHRAYAEWMPVRLGPDARIYRRLRFGTLADLSMLDLRSYRSQQASGVAVDDPNRTITGHAQLDWLLSGLATSTTRWKLVGNPVMISRLDFGTLPAWSLGPLATLLGIPSNGYTVNPDDWDGYNADREHLVNFLRANRVSNVVFLTGDIHSSWASELTTRTTVQSPTAVEFVVTSVTSDNVDDFTHTPPDTLSLAIAGVLRAANPHVKWAELDQHGYGVLDVTPDRCRMDWYFVTDRTKADAGAYLARSFSVDNGVARLHEEVARLHEE